MVSGLYLEAGDWGLVRDHILGDNLLQAHKLSSAKRTVREILYRLQKLLPQELKYFSEADSGDQRYVLWIAICRHYQFIGDFGVSVLREKFLSLAGTLDYADFDQFFEKESRYHSELESVTDSTRKKLRQVLFRIMREAGLLTLDKQIIPATPSEQFIQVVTATDPAALRYLPMDGANQKKVVA